MADFIEQQWSDYRTKLQQTAEYLAGEDADLKRRFESEMNEWMPDGNPGSYPELLDRIADGGNLVVSWQEDSPRELASEPGQSDQPYGESTHHGTTTKPTETLAEQSADARDNPVDGDQESSAGD